VLPRSTFSFNLALLNPHPARLFVPLPCEGCWLDGFLFFNLAKRSNMTLFLQELCKVFPSSVAYAMPKTYIESLRRCKTAKCSGASSSEALI